MAKVGSKASSPTPTDQDQYKTVSWLIQAGDRPNWVPEAEQERLAAYTKYEQIYWTDERAFRLMRRGAEIEPIIIPQARTIVDSTAHYLLKGLRLEAPNGQPDLDSFLKREKFNSRFHIAKHSGVVRGDWVMHITADPDAEDGSRISLNSVDPASYFPIYDDDDLDKIIKVYLVELFQDGDGQDAVKRKVYGVENVSGKRRISVEEAVYEADPDKWYQGKGIPPLKRTILKSQLLPESIQAIPVYHFKNIDWQGQPYGSSEIRGFERVMASINQTLSDEELALALEGLGVYATDGGSPVDSQGNAVPWEIGPGKVMEVANGAYFKRVEGVTSVSPMMEHVRYLEEQAMEASGTFRAGQVEVQVAESGIALAIRFLPTLAKIEERDLEGVDITAQMFHDWTYWMDEYESTKIKPGDEIEPVLGEKLPINRQELVSELNNMLDRNVISRDYYRDQMTKLFGMKFPDTIADDILEELELLASFKTTPPGLNPEEEQDLASGNPDNPDAPTGPQANKSNNKNRSNESNGNEAGHTLQRQGRPPGGKKERASSNTRN